MSTKRTCPACNEEVMQGDEYCATCGASLSGFWMSTWTSPPPQDAQGSPTADDDWFIPLPLPQAPEHDPRRTRTVIVLIVVAIILVGGILAVAYFLARQNDERSSQTRASESTSLDTSIADIADRDNGVIVFVGERFNVMSSRSSRIAPDASSSPTETAAIAGREPPLARFSLRPSSDEIVHAVVTPVQAESLHDVTEIRLVP